MKFEGEAICTYCGWDSIALRVEARFATRDAETLGGFEELRTIETMSEREDAAAVWANKLIHGNAFNNNEPNVA